MSYLCAGIYAEGPTDYAFLLPLVDQMLPRLAASLLRGVPVLGDSVGIDAPGRVPSRRAERISSAIEAFWSQCTLFIVHADGGGDPLRVVREQIDPAFALARQKRSTVAAAACVPVREIEAWMLADETPFRRLMRTSARLELPPDPEAVLDPKRELRRLLSEIGGPSLRQETYSFFAANLDVLALARLSAYRAFEAQLADAIRALQLA